MALRYTFLRLLLCLCIWPIAFSTWATEAEQAAIPALHRHVTDTTGTLSSDAAASLEQQLAELSRLKGVQMAILMVPTTHQVPIEDYAQRAFEAWKLGRKGIDDGLLIVVAKQDRRLRVHVGYGLEGTVTDLQAKQISRDYISPAFKLGDYEGGLSKGVRALTSLIEGDSTLPGVSPAGADDEEGLWPISLGLLLLDVILAPFVATRLIRKRWRPAWLPGGPLLPLLVGVGVAGLYCLLLNPAGLVTLPFLGYGVIMSNRFLADHFDPQARDQRLMQDRRRGPFDPYTTGGIGGSSGGFGSGHSGGFGGGSDFGGGGGDSGGGGASDSW